MSLGLFKRVALWRQEKHTAKVLQGAEELTTMDVSNPELPLRMANYWRDVTVSVFTDIPMEKQISYVIERNHRSLEAIAEVLYKTIHLIVEDDYEHLVKYLQRHLVERHTNPVAVYLTDPKGIPIDTEATFTRINSLLYRLADILDGFESYEYHRLINPIYRELINVITRLLEIRQR